MIRFLVSMENVRVLDDCKLIADIPTARIMPSMSPALTREARISRDRASNLSQNVSEDSRGLALNSWNLREIRISNPNLRLPLLSLWLMEPCMARA